MQWLPYNWKMQWLYIMYRLLLFFYFLLWTMYIISLEPPGKSLIFLTNWSLIVWDLYLFVSVTSVSINQLRQYICPTRKQQTSLKWVCCVFGKNQATLCDKISWLLFVVSAESAVAVTLLYWVRLREDGASLYPAVHHPHLTSGIVATLDLWITGLPVHLFQILYSLLFTSTYAAFTGVYYIANGTNTQDNFIYPVLDYDSNPGLATAVVVVVGLIFLPLIHVCFIVQYLLRTWATVYVHRRVKLYTDFEDESSQVDSVNGNDTSPTLTQVSQNSFPKPVDKFDV